MLNKVMLAVHLHSLLLTEAFTARKFEEQKRTAEIITIEKVRVAAFVGHSYHGTSL